MAAHRNPIYRDDGQRLAKGKDRGHDVRVTRPVEQTQDHSPVPLIRVRPTVKLYQNEDEEEPRDRQEDLSIPNSPVDTNPDSDYDAPYIPGRGAENTRRCLTWLRNVGSDEDGPTPESERSS